MSGGPRVVWRSGEAVPDRDDLEARMRVELRDVPDDLTVYVKRIGNGWSVSFEPASLVGTFPSGTTAEAREDAFEQAREESAQRLEPARLRVVAMLRKAGLDAS
jgi:hypothetical protein